MWSCRFLKPASQARFIRGAPPTCSGLFGAVSSSEGRGSFKLCKADDADGRTRGMESVCDSLAGAVCTRCKKQLNIATSRPKVQRIRGGIVMSKYRQAQANPSMSVRVATISLIFMPITKIYSTAGTRNGEAKWTHRHLFRQKQTRMNTALLLHS